MHNEQISKLPRHLFQIFSAVFLPNIIELVYSWESHHKNGVNFLSRHSIDFSVLLLIVCKMLKTE